jgi:hypothetical protein
VYFSTTSKILKHQFDKRWMGQRNPFITSIHQLIGGKHPIAHPPWPPPASINHQPSTIQPRLGPFNHQNPGEKGKKTFTKLEIELLMLLRVKTT